MTARRDDLDRAKGLGILLVVLGHVVAREPPTGNDWYVLLKYAVYQFHMPFFMYLSGYVTWLSGAARTPPAAWAGLVRKRAARLLVPFLLFGLAIVVGKLVAARFIFVDNLPGSTSQALMGLIWRTDQSPATSVWYIAVLFMLCVATPPLMWISRGRASLLVALALVLYLLPIPHVVYLDRVGTYFLFFALGGWAADAGESWLRHVDRWTWWSLAALLAIVVTFTLPQTAGLPPSLKLAMAGAVSMPALHGWIRQARWGHAHVLAILGTYSFVIYLLNTVFIGVAKGVMLKFFSWNGAAFLVYAPLLLLAGTAGPMLLKRYVLRPFPALNRMTD